MARYAAEGAGVTLLTCTLGELGEIVLPGIELLAAEHGDQLGGYRMGELAAAMKVLGVTDSRYLGGPARFRDSGMMGTPGNEAPRAFWRADSDPEVMAAAVQAAVAVIREVRPQVLITYDTNGGYGHPDHIMAHRVAMAACEAAADSRYEPASEPWDVAKIYWSAIPMSVLQHGIDRAKQQGFDFFGAENAEDMGIGCPDELVTTQINSDSFATLKVDAMRAHASQIPADSPFLAAIGGDEIWGTEYFRLVKGTVGELNAAGHETDLFAGLHVTSPEESYLAHISRA